MHRHAPYVIDGDLRTPCITSAFLPATAIVSIVQLRRVVIGNQATAVLLWAFLHLALQHIFQPSYAEKRLEHARSRVCLTTCSLRVTGRTNTHFEDHSHQTPVSYRIIRLIYP